MLIGNANRNGDYAVTRKTSNTVVVSAETVARIKGMVARGDKQMDVATYFGLNQGRVNEVINGTGAWGKRYAHVTPSSDDLPEAGPYSVVGRRGYEALKLAAAVPSETLQHILSELAAIKELLRHANTNH